MYKYMWSEDFCGNVGYTQYVCYSESMIPENNLRKQKQKHKNRSQTHWLEMNLRLNINILLSVFQYQFNILKNHHEHYMCIT